MMPFSEMLTVHEDAQRRTSLRNRVETLLDLAQSLPPRDRLILEQVYRHGLSVAEVARLIEEPAGRVRRRIARLIRLVQKPEFKFLARHEALLPANVRQTCRLVVFEGMSLRRTARHTGQTLHRVRQQVATFHALARF